MSKTNQVTAAGATELCYLCGEPLKDPINKDHIPPQQFFAAGIRQRYQLTRLLTARVHEHCNTSYGLEEEYFACTLMPYIRKSEAGLALYNEILAKHRRGGNAPLIQQLFDGFEHQPSGLVLPWGQILHRYDGERISRVAYKIVRGLHFLSTGEVLRHDLTVACTVTTPDDGKPPEHFIAFRDMPENHSLGHYPGVFAYRFQIFPENNGHYWAFLFWDLIIVTVAFVDTQKGGDD